jgi:hypothetical protein
MRIAIIIIEYVAVVAYFPGINVHDAISTIIDDTYCLIGSTFLTCRATQTIDLTQIGLGIIDT